MVAWLAGCQLVAMNYQTNDKPMWVYRGRFYDNGGCGYVLKPKRWLRAGFNPLIVAPNTECVLVVEVISGWQLPLADDDDNLIDPYVQVDTYGHPGDKKKCRTQTVRHNGFNPCWRQRFTFPLREPDAALLMFRVMDEDQASKDDLIGYRVEPVSCLLPGYRSVYLRNAAGDRIPNATLLVHIEIGNDRAL